MTSLHVTRWASVSLALLLNLFGDAASCHITGFRSLLYSLGLTYELSLCLGNGTLTLKLYQAEESGAED